MDALLASLSGPDTPQKVGGTGSGSGPSNGSISSSMPSSMGHSDRGSDNDVRSLARGGDVLSHALRRGPTSHMTSSATSRKSSCQSERRSIASRGRPLKPHEADPFLAVICTKTKGALPSNPQPVPVISVEDNEDTTEVNHIASPIPPTLSSKTIQSRESSESGAVSKADSHTESQNGSISTQWREPKAPANTPSLDPRVNQLVTSPFKQSRNQTGLSQYSAPSPGHVLRERTVAAVSQANKILTQTKSPGQKMVQGRLLKGRLKPLYPVTVKGPTIDNCRGIVSDTHTYSPSPSRRQARRDYTMENFLREYSFNRPETVESLHRTSVASSESEFENRTADAVTMAAEEGSEYDLINEVHRVNSGENLRSGMANVGIQQEFVEDEEYNIEDETRLFTSHTNDQSSDTNNNSPRFEQRPKTALGGLKVDEHCNDESRPHSVGYMASGLKIVRFAEISGNTENEDGSRSKTAEKVFKPFNILPAETLFTVAPPSGKDLKHKSADSFTFDDGDTPGITTSAKKAKPGSRSSCRPSQLNGKGRAPGGEDSDDEDRGGNNWDVSGAEHSKSAGSRSGRRNSANTGGTQSQSDGSNFQGHGRQAAFLTRASPSFERGASRCKSAPSSGARNKQKHIDFEAIYGQRKAVFSVRSLNNQHLTPGTKNAFMSLGQLKPANSKPTLWEKTHVFNFATSGERKSSVVLPTHMSAEYNMSPRVSIRTRTVEPEWTHVGEFSFENLEAAINAVQSEIRDVIENKSEFDELDTYREHNLDDLVLNNKEGFCKDGHCCEPIDVLSDSDDFSDSEDDVAVISADFLEENFDKSSTLAEYSEVLLAGNFQHPAHPEKGDYGNREESDGYRRKHSLTSQESSNHTEDDWLPRNNEGVKSSLYMSSLLEMRSDSGFGSNVWSESAPVSHSDEMSHDGDLRSEISEEDGKSFLEMMCEALPPLPQEDASKENESAKRVKDFGELKVVATTKELMKLRKESSPTSLSSKPPPLCFRINAQPPPGYLYYFTYSTDMNANRLSTYIQRDAEERFWGLLFGFTLTFNKKGVDSEAGGFPSIEVDHGGSVEGCLYLLTPTELDRLDRCVGYPEHYEHAMFPVWMSNCRDPDNYGVAQYCVPALTYIAQDQWIDTDSSLDCDYSLGQCLQHADLLTPAYKEYLVNMNKTVHPISG